jgi:hypothetical protein
MPRPFCPISVLNYLADRMEMAHSIEGRVPFLDHHVAEVAARVPVNMKVKGLRHATRTTRCSRSTGIRSPCKPPADSRHNLDDDTRQLSLF